MSARSARALRLGRRLCELRPGVDVCHAASRGARVRECELGRGRGGDCARQREHDPGVGTPGDYWWYASYGGDPSDNPAASACGGSPPTAIVAVGPPVVPGSTPHAPVLSAVTLGSKRFAARRGTWLRLTVSQPATIRVLIDQTVKGHRFDGMCRRRIKKRKRCTTTVTRRTLTFSARAGANAFKLKLKGLATGRYTAAITAQNTTGKSGTVELKFRITHK